MRTQLPAPPSTDDLFDVIDDERETSTSYEDETQVNLAGPSATLRVFWSWLREHRRRSQLH